MSAPARLTFWCIILLGACRPALARSRAVDVDALRQEATASRTKAEADQKLDQAEALLAKSRKSMNSLDYAFLQNEITQARGLVCIAFWQTDRSDTRLRDEGRRLLLTALDKYDWLGQRSEDRAESIEQKFNSSQLARNEEYKTVVGNISRANYKTAWTQYLLGMSADGTDEREKRLKSALDGFISFTARGYRNDPIVADCFIGQARCLYELERYFEVTELLDPEKINNNNTTPNMLRRVTELRIKAYGALSRHLMVDDCASLYFETLPEDHKFDATELDIAIAWARSLAFLISNPAFDKYTTTYQRRLAKIRKDIARHGELWRTRLAGALRQSGMESPLGYVERARQYFTERRYDQALEETEKGLSAIAADASADDVAVELKYIRFAVYWNQNRWAEAHEAAASFLKNNPNDSRAEDICNKAVESGLRALESEPPLEVAQLLKLLELVERDFPDASQATKAPWYRGHLHLQEGQYAAAISVLEAIPVDSEVYRQAQLDLARASFQKAEVARVSNKGNTQEPAKLYLAAAAALGRFANERPEEPLESELVHSQSAVELAVPVTERLLALDPPEPNAVLALIDRIRPLQDADGKPDSRLSAAAAEAGLMTGNTDVAHKLIDELLAAESSETHLVTALINVANRLEQIRAAMAKRGRDCTSTDRKLVRIYVSLLDRVGRSDDAAVRGRESAVRLRLAKRLLGLQRYREAIDHYAWHLKNAPSEESYDAVRGLAISYEQIGQYEPALRQWSRLYRGTKRRTDEWIEAAYHVIDCHIKAGDRGRASKVLAHFRTLCPQSELGQWAKKFEAIETVLLKSGADTGP